MLLYLEGKTLDDIIVIIKFKMMRYHALMIYAYQDIRLVKRVMLYLANN